MKLFHRISRTKAPCKPHLRWNGNALQCEICKAVAGFRWLYQGEVCVYLYPEHRDLQNAVEAMPETHLVRDSKDVLGDINFKDFEQFISDIRNLKNGTPIGRHAEL